MNATFRELAGDGKGSDKSSLRRNFSWTFCGDLTFGACQWAMLAVLAKLGTPEMVGNYSFALAVTAPVILFANMNLRAVVATDAQKSYCFGEYFGLRILMLALSIATIAVIVAVVQPSRQITALIAMVTVAKVFDSLSDIMYGLQQHHERMDYISLSRIMQGLLQVTSLALALKLTGSLVLSAAAVAIVSALITIFYDIRNAARLCSRDPHDLYTVRQIVDAIRPSWDRIPLQSLVRLAAPLGFVAVFGMLNVNIPRYYIQSYVGPRGLGIFSAMWSMLAPLGLATSAILQPILPQLARAYQNNGPRYRVLVELMLVCSAITAVVGLVGAHYFGRFVLSHLFRPAYATHPIAFEWIMAASGMVYFIAVFTSAINAARNFGAQPYIIFVSMCLNAVACFFLVPRFGILGAAWAYCVGCGVWMLGFGFLTLKALRMAGQRHRNSAAVGDTSFAGT